MNPQLNSTALPHYDELYPGKTFAEYDKNGVRTLVGLTQTLTGQTIFAERVKKEPVDGLILEISHELNRKAEKAKRVKGGYVVGYTAPGDYK